MTSINLPATCLVDTTYLINLVQPKAPFHANALAFTQALQGNQTRFHLPTLVMAEYAVGAGSSGVGAILSTLSATVCGFDMAAALRYGELTGQPPSIFNAQVPEKERSVVDLMLIAIADTMSLESIITSDKNICGQFLKGTSIQPLDIRSPIASMYPLWKDAGGS